VTINGKQMPTNSILKEEIIKQIRLVVHPNQQQLDEGDLKLLDIALEATQKAYAPYSDFHVGAAIRLANGEIMQGCNQENAAFPSGLCAERVAFFAAGVQFPGIGIESLAITIRSTTKADHDPATPCGACLQVMRDVEQRQGQPIRILLKGSGAAVYEAESVATFLPFSFSLLRK
jgi:cytidine deaminase